MSDNLKDKTYRGAFWSAADAGGAKLAQFVISVLLARLLLPEEVGLIGMLAIFMAVSQSFLTSGFGLALIQKKEVTRVDTSSVFYFNLAIGLVLAGLLCLAAPWIAAFYKQPVLTPLTRAMSLVIVINSFAIVQTAMLTRNIDFRTQAKVNLIATIASGVFGVALAARGFGVWSLVSQQLSSSLLTAVLLWAFNGWRPVWSFSFHALRRMFAFGSRMLLSGLLNQVFENIYEVVIGRLFHPATLGFYTTARRIEGMPSQTLSQIVSRVSLPVFSAIHEDDVRLKGALKRAMAGLVFLNTPLLIGLAVVAEPLVRVVLTEKWLPSVPYLQLLCVISLLFPLHVLNLNALMAKGRSDLFLRLELVKKVLTVANIVVTWHWGVMAMIGGQLLLSLPCYYLNSYYTAKLIRYTAAEQLRDVASYFACAAVMGVGVYALRYVPFHSDVVRLVAQIVCGVAVYTSLCGALRLPAFQETWSLLAKRLPLANWGAI